MNENDGMNYIPKDKPKPVVKPGEFVFAAIALNHGHIYGMCNSLINAGATLKSVYDPDPKKIATFLEKFPNTHVAESEEEILNDSEVKLVAAAAITNLRCALGLRVMDAGKDYFTDKAPFTTLEQLASAKAKVKETGRKYMVCYSERLQVEGAIFAGDLIKQGTIGRVLQVIGLGPHRLGKEGRPDWFFNHEEYGGILCDIGSHQIEQYLYFAGEEDATVASSKVANYENPDKPELEDFGDCTLIGKNGTTNYFRVDWFTPSGLRSWGDGRTIILGTEGYIEIRKYVDIATDKKGGNHVFLVNKDGEQYFNVTGKIGFPFFGQFILDCINRTEHAMTQAHAFKAAELCLQAQKQAIHI
ncbi:MAG: oxidoreductase [Candidatus Epulonipiscioides saccharophilum]|nr:MAG: oxidoreductase [Epulopiscium sp. AS2M-Bin001]